jgi:putative flippase GtrA
MMLFKKRLLDFSARFFWFGLSGIIGFMTDTGVLYLLKDFLGLYGARAVSFVSAVFMTWVFNRTITFRNRISGHSKAREFGIYIALMLAGGSVNYAIYAFMIASYANVAQQPVLGVACGSIAGMTINLLTSRFLLFRHQHQHRDSSVIT